MLDNVDTPEALAEALRLAGQLPGGHVLMTSRLDNFPVHVEALAVDLLSPAAAEAFLLERTARRRRRAPDDDAQARELAKELGWLALALEHAGAYIEARQLGFAEYQEVWRESRDKVIRWADETITGYPRSVAETWQVSVDRLTEAGRHLLERLAFLAPDTMPEFLLDVPVPGSEGEDPREALADLAAYSLATREPAKARFSVHRLVQDATRRSLDPAVSRQRLAEALGWVNAAFEGDPDDVRAWPRLDPLAPHAASVAEHADVAEIAEPTTRLMNQLAVVFIVKSLHSQAEPLMRRALAIGEENVGPDHPEVATDLNNLAQLLKATNRLGEAEPLICRALSIDEKSFGPDHPNVARASTTSLHCCKTSTGSARRRS